MTREQIEKAANSLPPQTFRVEVINFAIEQVNAAIEEALQIIPSWSVDTDIVKLRIRALKVK